MRSGDSSLQPEMRARAPHGRTGEQVAMELRRARQRPARTTSGRRAQRRWWCDPDAAMRPTRARNTVAATRMVFYGRFPFSEIGSRGTVKY